MALFTKQFESNSSAAHFLARQRLQHWKQDADLAGIRDAAAVAKLSVDEQKACTQLWADVAALLKKAQTPAAKEDRR